MFVPKLRARRKKAADLNSAETHLTQPPVDPLNLITRPRSKRTGPTSYSTNVTGPCCEIQTRGLDLFVGDCRGCRVSLVITGLTSRVEIGEEQEQASCYDREGASNNISCEVGLVGM